MVGVFHRPCFMMTLSGAPFVRSLRATPTLPEWTVNPSQPHGLGHAPDPRL